MRLTHRGNGGEASRGRERGSVVFLFPVGFLIIVILGAIAVDLSNVWLQQRRLADAAESAANDAVTYGVDEVVLRTTGELSLSSDRVQRAVVASIAAHELPAGTTPAQVGVGVSASGEPTVEVRLSASVDLIFGRLVRPGGVAIAATGVAEITPD